MALLVPATPEAVQMAALAALARRREVTNVLSRWTQLSRPARARAVS